MRKKKKHYMGLLLLCALMMFALCSCTTKKHKETEESETDLSKTLPDVVFPKDQFFIHVYGEAKENLPQDPDADTDQEVTMRYFTRKTDPTVSVVRMDNPKAMAAYKSVFQNTLNQVTYRGFFYMELQLKFDFSCLKYGETLAVNSITFSIGGEECTVDTTGRLFLTRWTKEEENAQVVGNQHGVQISEIMSEQFSMQGNASFAFRCKTFLDATIEKVEVCDWYEISDESSLGMYQNKNDYTNLGKMKENMPVTVPSGQELLIDLKLSTKNGNPFSNCRTQVKLYYRTESGAEGILYQTIEPARPEKYNDEEEAVMWMDAYVAPSSVALEKTVFLEEFMYEDLVLLDGEDLRGRSADDDGGWLIIYFLYEDALPYIRLESINGKGVRGERDRVSLETYRDIGPYQSYRIAELHLLLDYSDMRPGTRKEIETIGLSVNGAMLDLDFKGRLCYEKAEGGTVLGRLSRGAISSGSITPSGQREYVSYGTCGDVIPVVVDKIEVLGPLQPDNIRIEVDGVSRGTPEAAFPLSLYQGQNMFFYTTYDYDGLDPYATYSFSVLVHVHEEGGDAKIYRENYYLLGYEPNPYNRVTEKFITHALKMKKDHT